MEREVDAEHQSEIQREKESEETDESELEASQHQGRSGP